MKTYILTLEMIDGTIKTRERLATSIDNAMYYAQLWSGCRFDVLVVSYSAKEA